MTDWSRVGPQWRRPGSPPPLPPREWVSQGLCVTVRGDWFPEPRQAADSTMEKAVCRQCPVRAACLAYALDAGENFGIWGGLTTEERRTVVHHLTSPVTTGSGHGPSRAA